MKKSKVVIMLGAALGVASFLGFKTSDRNFEISKNLDIFHNVFRELDMFYVDTVDVEKVIRKGINAMLSSIDPYTVYYPQDDQDDLKRMTTGKYAGIGAVVRNYPSKGYVAIEEPYEGMPASRYGLKAGDLILSIDGENMKGKSVEFVSDHLRGDPNTRLVVTVQRPGVADSLDVEIIRATVALPSVPYYGMQGDAGYIMLDGFTENCSRDVRRALLDLKEQGAKGIIIDLRGNGGGLLNEAVEIVSLFVPKGTRIVETRGKTRQSNSEYDTRRDPVDLDIPLVVLVDGNSASSSEILSGSLQDLDRAVIVGDRTYGKGLVQTTRSLPYNGTLKVTTSKYYIPSGRCIQELDYSHRDASGVATRVPDSLTHVFTTSTGRQVRDGGGIRPDIKCLADTMPDIMYYLSNDVVLFDFVNQFCVDNKSIAPASDFVVSDSLYNAFKEYVKSSDFKFTSRSSQALKSLESMAASEGLKENAKEEFKALADKLQYDMNRDLDQFEDDLKLLLATEILTRYYYQKGAIQEGLKYDAALDTAQAVIADAHRYNTILNRPVKK